MDHYLSGIIVWDAQVILIKC